MRKPCADVQVVYSRRVLKTRQAIDIGLPKRMHTTSIYTISQNTLPLDYTTQFTNAGLPLEHIAHNYGYL